MPELLRFFAASSDLLLVTRGTDACRINPAFRRMLSWQESEIIASPVIELVHAGDRSAAEAALERLGRGGPVAEATLRMRIKGGGWRTIEWHATAFPDEDLHPTLSGEPVGTSRSKSS